MFIVGHEQVRGVTDKQTLVVEQFQAPQRGRHLPVEPVVQPLGAGVTGELAQEVLVAGRLPVRTVLVVEAGQNRLTSPLPGCTALRPTSGPVRSSARPTGSRKDKHDRWWLRAAAD